MRAAHRRALRSAHRAPCAISCSSPWVRSYGTNTPWTANSVFGVVDTTPSAPPSNTCTWPICQFERRISFTTPGITASAVVLTEQLEPIEVLADTVQGIVTPNVVSCITPTSEGPL